ncbi:MAG TPA: nuclear transport factor 2 family protein [Fimbriimonas sp.]|nr:nuclear transport factor 2 family protein [Fimbriimonas sp.]
MLHPSEGTFSMNEQQNISTIQDMYAAFGRGDVDSIVSKLSPDVQWHSYLDPAVPWAGSFNTTKEVPNFFKAIYESVDVQSFDPGEFIANGDTVISIGTFGSTAKSTGKSTLVKWIFVWKFRDGKVTSYEQFQDSKLAKAFVA